MSNRTPASRNTADDGNTTLLRSLLRAPAVAGTRAKASPTATTPPTVPAAVVLPQGGAARRGLSRLRHASARHAVVHGRDRGDGDGGGLRSGSSGGDGLGVVAVDAGGGGGAGCYCGRSATAAGTTTTGIASPGTALPLPAATAVAAKGREVGRA